MDADVAYAESVPRYVDLALFLCGEALRRIKGELRQHAAAATPLYAWHLHKVCFLHVLPSDGDGSVDDAMTDAVPSAAAATQFECAGPLISAASSDQLDDETARALMPALSAESSKEVSFRRAYAHLRRPCSVDSSARVHEKPNTHVTPAAAKTSERGVGRTSQMAGQVHPRSPCEVEHRWNGADAPPPSPCLSAMPTDVGFALLCDCLRTAAEAGGEPLMQRLAAALCDAVMDPKRITASPGAHPSPMGSVPSSQAITAAQLSDLFDEDLFNDELSAEAGNATRSFRIWVNYEWATASFARQTRLAATVTKWIAALRGCRDGPPSQWLLVTKHRTAVSTPPPPLACGVPINVRRMYAALENVFEGHTRTRAMLMELSLAQRIPHLTDSALVKLLSLQGPPTSTMMSRAELSNRGTQPILMCITSGMLLYAQYYLSFRSLAVARQCARVALQVAQEVPSNAILSLAHYTAHVVATHQGRPSDAANSISIALQLTLPNGSGSSGQRGGLADEPLSTSAPTLSGTEAQMVSLAFAGAAQLLLFFPGAVDPALRSLLSTGQRGSGSGVGHDAAGARHTRGSGGGPSKETPDFVAKQSGAVTMQTVAQSIRHSLLRAHTALLEAPPPEGRWMGVVSSLQRETLLLIGSMYGIVSSPLLITTASLRQLLEEVKEETSTASPLYSHHPRCMLLLEVLRHAAHHALALQEGFLEPAMLAADGAEEYTAQSKALRCLHSALTAISVHYGNSALATANEAPFFSSVVRYCAGCQLHMSGYVAAAYDVWSRVAAALNPTAGADGAEGGHGSQDRPADEPAHSGGAAAVSDSLEDADEAHFWPPDHLLLYASVQRRRAQAALFLGYIAAPHRLQEELLTISSRYAFPFGVLTARLIEAQVHQQHGRFSASLSIARHVERAAARIGYPSLCEAARALQVTAYSNCGCWGEAQHTLARCRPTTAAQRTFFLLQQYAAHLEPLLLHAPVSTEKVECLTRSWIALLMREGLLAAGAAHDGGDVRVRATAAGISSVDEVCLYSSLQRACALLGCRTDAIAKRAAECMEVLRTRQHYLTPDLCVHGSCEELCRYDFRGGAPCEV
ncbi:hypothetical protein LSCM1_08025 [Leishmania martiniquensis]|uniref:Uncharacterized protein n=1 Tax=Leishmania martiniquensis TaxID=1580590 RepID=A0A836KTL3_9TRYP|nr:hypothetical protein LSCM1_08025 [Leishmania martiniquensis]